MTCLITGCVATINGNEWVGGDLHKIGSSWVFNAVMTRESGEANWQSREYWTHYDREVRFVGNDIFERRGVIVSHYAELNANASAYVFKT